MKPLWWVIEATLVTLVSIVIAVTGKFEIFNYVIRLIHSNKVLLSVYIVIVIVIEMLLR